MNGPQDDFTNRIAYYRNPRLMDMVHAAARSLSTGIPSSCRGRSRGSTQALSKLSVSVGAQRIHAFTMACPSTSRPVSACDSRPLSLGYDGWMLQVRGEDDTS